MAVNWPKGALRVQFRAMHDTTHYYYVWQAGTGWCWYALGNEGNAVSQALAMQAARDWIRDGVKGISHEH